MAGPANPFTAYELRPHLEGDYAREELALAYRNSALPLEALAWDVTPVGLHYTLSHFDIPRLDAASFRLAVGGRVERPLTLEFEDIRALAVRTQRVTLECAGNGRGLMSPRSASMPWLYEGVGTAEWTGTPLRNVLEPAGVAPDAVEIVFIGADRGFDRGHEHTYGRSLTRAVALGDDILVVWAMNGAPLPPQHGYPLRLVVPGWYGMASVKWLNRIEALAKPYDGFQQVSTYMYRPVPGGPTTPVTHMRVKSLLVPPGIPDFYSRHRMVGAGPTQLYGRAWSGAGVPIARVEVGIVGTWHEAELDATLGKFAWPGWRFTWDARVGEHELCCRATDADGETQPLQPRWDTGGFGNNVVQRVQVTVR